MEEERVEVVQTLPFVMIPKFVMDALSNYRELVVYAWLAYHANSKRTCWPSIGRIARIARIGKATVLTALKELAEKGLIEITKADGGVNRYELMAVPSRTEGGSIQNRDRSYTEPHAVPARTGTIQREQDKEKKNVEIPFDLIIGDLNTVTHRRYRADTKPIRDMIRARWNEGYRVEDFQNVHSHKWATWGRDARMLAYVRPSTLYRASHFMEYVEAARAWKDGERAHEAPPKKADRVENFVAEIIGGRRG